MDNLKCFYIDWEQSQLSTLGFEKREVCASTETTSTLFLRNAPSVLVQKIRSAQDYGIYFGSTHHGPISHPISDEIVHSACRADEQHIKYSKRLDLVWKTVDKYNLVSVVGCSQSLSDKSETSLKAGGLAFYPLHVTPLNFNKWMRRLYTLSGAAVLAYPLVTF